MREANLELFAVSPPGMEGLLAQELKDLGLPGKVEIGGVSFRGGLRELYLSNLWLRTANRILLRVARFRALAFYELIRKTERYPWETYIPEGYGVKLRVTSYRSKLYHERAIKERILKALGNRLGRDLRETTEKEVLVVVRFVRDRCTISVDTSGGDLFRRGYKVGKGPTTLRENLAAALVLSSGWDRRMPLLDPFCGTGTIPIEAALIAANRAPGLLRHFSFEKWENFDSELWEEIKAEARSRENAPPPKPFIFAGDASDKALSATRENLQASGLEPWIEIFQLKLENLLPPSPEPGYIVTDPPYGRRLKPQNLKAIYSTLGRVLKENFLKWRLVVIFPEVRARELSRLTGLPFRQILATEHGGLWCTFLASL